MQKNRFPLESKKEDQSFIGRSQNGITLKGLLSLFILSLSLMMSVSAQTTYYVNDNSTTGDTYTTAVGNDATGTGTAAAPYATITKAITVAAAGSTIKVDAGVYSAALTINKSLTLQGPNVGRLGTATRIAEAQIKDVKISISGTGAIIFDGFYVYQTTTATGATIDISNTPATVRNNIIERSGSTGGVIAVGVQTPMSSTASINIQRNLFTGSLAGSLFSGHKTWNSGIYSNGGSNILIDNNTIQNCRTGINSDNQSSGVTVSNNTFSNNGTHMSFGGTSATSGSYSMSGNTFSVTLGLTTINLSNVTTSFRLDLTNNTFGSTAASSMSLSQCFDVENTLTHKGASSKNGLVTFVSGKLFKTSTTTFANNISYATAGDGIYVASGTFNEAVSLNKSVNLYGINSTVNPNDGSWNYNSSRAAESIISGNAITIAASNVEVSGFKITSISSSGFAIGNTNPAATYSNVVVKNNWITGLTNTHPIWFTASSGQAYDGFQILNNRIEGNTVSPASTQVTGIDMWRSGNHTVSGNYVSGASYNGIKSDGYQTNVITGNKIVNCKVAGISIQPTYANGQVVTCSNNDISGCQEGVAIWSSTTTYPNIKFQVQNNTIAINAGKLDINYPAINVQNISSGDDSYTNTISGNTITYSGTIGSAPYGFFPGPASAAYGMTILGNVGKLNVQNNVIDGGNVAGLSVSDPNQDMAAVMVCTNFPIINGSTPVATAFGGTVTIQNNDIKNFKNGIVTYDFISSAVANIPSGSSLSVTNNSIVAGSSGKAFITGSGTPAITGTCNWYGSATYSDVAAKITGNVTFLSFLVNGTDNDGATRGFQPVSGACTGTDLSTPTLGASSGVFTSITQSSLRLSFTRGNGSNRAVVVRLGHAITADPTNNQSYTANTTYGSGSNLDSGYVVYTDTSNAVTVTGLIPSTTYYFTVVEYNVSGATIKYANTLKYNCSATTLQPDADNDGVADADDQYPNDQYKAFDNNFPASGFGTLMFEDLWPGKGDYDFNDLVVDYRFNTVTNADNNVVEVKYTFVTRAIGGSLHNGFAFQLDGINPNKITTVTGSKATGASWIALNPNGTESGQATNANILVFDDAYKLLPGQNGFSFVNVFAAAPSSGTDTTTITVKFLVNGTAPEGGTLSFTSFGSALFNPYLITGQDRGKEIHLADRLPSAKMNATYFGQEQDRTNASQGKYFKTADNLPWAINVSTSIPYTQEKNDISTGYLKFIDWASSGGVNSTSWYTSQSGNRDNSKLIIR